MLHTAPIFEPLEVRRLLSASHWTHVTGRVFIGTAAHEALEVLNAHRIVYEDCTFRDGTTDCRLNACHDVVFADCRFVHARGPADPDGSGLQLINCRDVLVEDSTFSGNPGDQFSNFGDRPTAGRVTLLRDRFDGTGTTDYSNAVCEDGPDPAPLDMMDCEVRGTAGDKHRCAVTIAGGTHSRVENLKLTNCETSVFIQRFYAGNFGENLVALRDVSRVLIGPDAGRGNVVRRLAA